MANESDIAKVASGAVSSVNPLLGVGTSLAMGALSALYNDSAMDEQFNRNVQMWKMQNAYNLPIRQKERLKQAGMNPLFYGLDGNAAGAPQPAPTAPTKNPFESILIAKQMQEMDGNIAAQRASARDLNATAEGKEIQNDILRDTKEEQKALNHLTIKYDAEEKKFWLKPDEWEGVESYDENGHPVVTVYAGSRLVKKLDTELNNLTVAFNAARADLQAKNYNAKELDEKLQYIKELVYADVLQKTSDAKAAAIGVSIAEQTFKKLQVENKQMNFDYNLDSENKEIVTKLGIFGTVARIFKDVFK